MPVRAIFCFVLIFRRQTIGIGGQRMSTSVKRFVKELPMKNLTGSMVQYPPGMVRSQKYAAGVHPNIDMNITIKYQQ